jgi:protein-S-isoprenylcysteine O-methyltransferase Ste14
MTKGKMKIWGVGPIIALITTVYGMFAMVISQIFYPFFKIQMISYHVILLLGILLILMGVFFLIVSFVGITKAYNHNNLVTKGIFSFCRHPIYASWLLFIVPGIVLLTQSWINLTIPIFMYFIVRYMVRKEEVYLEEHFGKPYLEYKNRTSCIIPFFHLQKSR